MRLWKPVGNGKHNGSQNLLEGSTPTNQSHMLKICSYLSGLDSDSCFGKTYDELVRDQQIKSLVAQTGSV